MAIPYIYWSFCMSIIQMRCQAMALIRRLVSRRWIYNCWFSLFGGHLSWWWLLISDSIISLVFLLFNRLFFCMRCRFFDSSVRPVQFDSAFLYPLTLVWSASLFVLKTVHWYLFIFTWYLLIIPYVIHALISDLYLSWIYGVIPCSVRDLYSSWI